MTPYDLMMWSAAVVVFLGCLLISILLIRAIYIVFARDEEEEIEGRDDSNGHNGVRRIK